MAKASPLQEARRNASQRRERIIKEGRRVDLLLPAEASAAIDTLAEPGETATRTIIRTLLHAAKRRR